MTKKLKTYIFLVLAMLAWGSVYPVSKYLMSNIHPQVLAFLRYFTAVIFLTPLFLIEIIKKGNSFNKKNIFYLFLSGLFGTTIFAIFLFKGVALSTASNGSIIINSQPIFTALIAYFILKAKISKTQVLGICLGFFGLIIIVTGGSLESISENSTLFAGNIFLVLGSISMSLYGITIEKPVKEIGGIAATWVSMAIGTTLLFFYLIISPEYSFANISFTSTKNIFLILYLGSIATSASYLLFTMSLKTIDVVSATGFKFLIPVTGVLLSVIFLKESPAAIIYAGILIVILSVFLIQNKKCRFLINLTRRSY